MLAFLFVFLELFSQGRTPIDTSREAEKSSAEACRDCHQLQYEEWRASRHSLAWTNDFFQYDYQQEKRQWCRNCHIPMVAQQGNTAAALALRDEGVNCIACHVRGDVFFAKSKRPGSPHNTQARASFGDDTFCAGCHQFNFPIFSEDDKLAGYTELPMQATVEQFRSGPFAKTHTCRDCHATSPGGHSYPGSHDLAMLRQALSFQVCRNGERVETVLTNIGAGHNVPTGDVHRHIVVKAWRSTAPEKLSEAFYGRRFAPAEGGGKETIWDSTLPPNTYRRWRFEASSLGASEEEPINVEVRYLFGSRESYRAPFSEPAYQLVFRVRRALDKLASCQ